MVFTTLGITLGLLIGTYWYMTLEPRLIAQAQSQANALAQAQANTLSSSLSKPFNESTRTELERAIDTILLIRDPSTSIPLIQRIEVEVDYSTIVAPPNTLNLARGQAECPDCFVSEVPLFHQSTLSLIGIARVFAGRDFVDTLIEDVQQKLVWSSIILMLFLVIAWVTAEWLLSKLRKSESNLQSIIDAVADPIFVFSNQHDLILQNKAAKSLSESEHIINDDGRKAEFIPSKEIISNLSREGRSVKLIHNIPQNNGKSCRMELLASPLSIEDNGAVVLIYRDITEYLEIVDELQLKRQLLQQLVEKDTLTQLPNRFLFTQLLSQAVARAQRNQSQLAILFLDLDRFKEVNDSLGHDAGDELLITAAKRLLDAVRSGDVVARLSGDEFVILLEDIKRVEDATSVAQHITDTIRQPLILLGKRLQPAASIGISIFPTDSHCPEQLLQNADTAMYRAKRQGRNTFRLYDSSMTAAVQKRISMIAELQAATEESNFVMLYQPQIDLHSKKLIGIEALLRWQKPDHSLVSPNDFLHLAEETGLSHLIGQWVLYNVCKQTKQWHSERLAPPRVAINISATELLHEDFLAKVKNILKITGCEGAWLAMEVTENLFIQRLDEAAKRLQQLKEMGFSIVIDDFGIGYSSLARLKKLPIDLLKLDKVFLENISQDSGNLAIVQTVLDMGQRLGIEVLAEGVETTEQETYLILSDYRIAQGYRYGRPMSPTRLMNRYMS